MRWQGFKAQKIVKPQKLNRMNTVENLQVSPAIAKPMLAVRALSNTQLAVYACLKNWGAEIQVDWENEKHIYTLVHQNGDIETVRSDTFNKLKRLNLISLKWRPSINVERWSW